MNVKYTTIQDAVKANKYLPFCREINDFKIIEYLKNPLSFDEIKKM